MAATIAAVALVGTTVPAQANTASIKVTQLKLQPTATYFTSTALVGAVKFDWDDDVTIYSAKTDVVVNNKTVATGVPIYPSTSTQKGGIDYKRSWGAGLVKLANIRVTGTDAVTGAFDNFPVAAPANSVRVKYAVTPKSGIKYLRVGKKLTFTATVHYLNAKNKAAPAGKAVIQYKKAGTWKVLKTLKLNAKGKATYKISLRTKRYYRLVVPSTTLVQGDATGSSRI